MAPASQSVSTGGRVAFQVDRFEFRAGDRCEIRGRWSGVRGRRFMRPALTVLADGRRVRLLADLEHKPWAAEDGQPWLAEFPCEFDRSAVQEAELTVAPDITVALPITGANRPQGKREVQQDRRRLAEEVERLATDRTATEHRVAELSAQVGQLISQRDELRSAHAEQSAHARDARVARDRMAAELETLRRDRAAALESAESARETAERLLHERAAAVAAQGRAESEREAAMAARDQALTERDAALAVRDHALAARDAATAARDRALAEHDALVRTNERLQTELADQISARRGAALVIRRAAQDPPASRPFALLIPRAIALVVVVLVVLVVLALVKII